jgi:hypothetical protein
VNKVDLNCRRIGHSISKILLERIFTQAFMDEGEYQDDTNNIIQRTDCSPMKAP